MNPSKPAKRSIIAAITALLPGLSEDGTRRVQAEVNIALAGRRLPTITLTPRGNVPALSGRNNIGVRVQIHSYPASVLGSLLIRLFHSDLLKVRLVHGARAVELRR